MLLHIILYKQYDNDFWFFYFVFDQQSVTKNGKFAHYH